jgi:REJ domain
MNNTVYPRVPNYLTLTKFDISIRIKQSPLFCYIEGGNRQISFDNDLTVDGSTSNDPDDQLNLGLSYYWTCSFLNMRPCQFKNSTVITFGNTSNLYFPAQSLVVDNTYRFTLRINKDVRSASAFISIKILVSKIPKVEIFLSKSTVFKKIDPGSDITVSSTVSSTSPNTVMFDWSLLLGSTLIHFTESNSIGQGTNQLKILASCLQSGQNYQLTLKVNDQNGINSAMIILPTNQPPAYGRISVSPQKGIAFLTRFQLSCSDWMDADLPMKYKFAFWRNQSQIGQMDKLVDATLYSYKMSVLRVLENPESVDNYIYMYTIAQDVYQMEAYSNFGVKVYVEPQYFPSLKKVENFKTELFNYVDLQNPTEVLETSSLVTKALNIYTYNRRLRNLADSPHDISTEQIIAVDLVSSRFFEFALL